MANRILGLGISVRADDPDLKDLPGWLDRAEQLGVEFVEIPTLAIDLVTGGRIMRPRLAALQAILKGRPFRYTAHGPIGINLMDAPHLLPIHTEVLAASIDVAAEIGALHYVVHTGKRPKGDARQIADAYAVQREHLARAGDRAKAAGMTLVVENIFTSEAGDHTALPGKLGEELAAIGHSHVKACIDFSHGFIHSTREGADYVAEIAALAPHAKHLHIHDSFGRPREIESFSQAERLAFGQGDLHLPIGWGAIPWDRLMGPLRFADEVIFNIELERRYWSEVEATVAAVRGMIARASAAT